MSGATISAIASTPATCSNRSSAGGFKRRRPRRLNSKKKSTYEPRGGWSSRLRDPGILRAGVSKTRTSATTTYEFLDKCIISFFPDSPSRSPFHDLVLSPFANRPSLAQDAPGHDSQAVADSQQFGQVGADHHDRLALRGELADEAVDLDLRADVDAS